MKTEYGSVLERLQERMKVFTENRESLESLLNKGFDKLTRLKKAYSSGTLSDAREMIGLIFPENFTFQNNQFQTARVNEIVSVIYLINNELKDKKNRTSDSFINLSRVVTSTGFKPVTF